MGNALNNFALGQVPQQSPGGFGIGAGQRQNFANQHLINLGAALMSPQINNLPNGNSVLDFGGTIGRALAGAQAGTNERVDTAHTQGMTLAEMLRRQAADKAREPLQEAQIRNLDSSTVRNLRPGAPGRDYEGEAQSELARQTRITEAYAAMSKEDKLRHGLTDREHAINLDRMRTGLGGRAENFDSLVNKAYPGLEAPSGWHTETSGSGLVWVNDDTQEIRPTGYDITGRASDPEISGSEYLNQVEKEFNKLMGDRPEIMPEALILGKDEETKRLKDMWNGKEAVPARKGIGPFSREARARGRKESGIRSSNPPRTRRSQCRGPGFHSPAGSR